jgi:hypothetical protein
VTNSTLSSTNRTEVSKPYVHVAEFLSLGFPSGTVRLTNAARKITWGGFDWVANGSFLVPGYQAQSADGKARRTELTLSGVDATLLGKFLTDAYHLSKVKIYKGFFTADWVLVADPHAIAPELLMSDALIEHEAGTGVIKLSCETYSIFDKYDSAVLATPESQRRRYPGDAGQDRCAALMTTVFEWGGVYARAGGGGGGHGLGAPIGSSGGNKETDHHAGQDRSSQG